MNKAGLPLFVSTKMIQIDQHRVRKKTGVGKFIHSNESSWCIYDIGNTIDNGGAGMGDCIGFGNGKVGIRFTMDGEFA